jgi:hypothetical protein
MFRETLDIVLRMVWIKYLDWVVGGIAGRVEARGAYSNHFASKMKLDGM